MLKARYSDDKKSSLEVIFGSGINRKEGPLKNVFRKKEIKKKIAE